MSRLIITEGAAQGLERCRLFLKTKGTQTAFRASQIILRQFEILEMNPEIGRPFDSFPELREWVIEFGDSGYIALYRFDPESDLIYVLAFRHQKEAGYR